MFNNTITLSNGVVVPQLALGTWLIDNDKAADAVKSAIELGYRHIDTAQAYMILISPVIRSRSHLIC